MIQAFTVRPLSDPADAALAAVERIYLDALPAGERKPLAWLRTLARPLQGGGSGPRSTYHLLVAESGEDVAGFAVLFVPGNGGDAALLEYLAVAATARGSGIGGRLFAHAARLAARPMLVEVEAGDADAGRRLAFYRRHGCSSVVGLRYALPLPDAAPMGLMVAGAATVGRADLSRWLATVYDDAYGQGRDDPRVTAMMAGLADPVELA